MTPMRLYAPAKVNWTLEVLGRRDDGYHEVRSVMQAIELYDELEIEPAGELRLEVDGEREACDDDLALRAAAVLDSGAGRGAHVRLTKRIPVAAGLGGGSSDAAAALQPGQWTVVNTGNFNRALLVQLNERLGFFIGMVEYDRLLGPDARVAHCLAALFNPTLTPGIRPLVKISQEEIGHLAGLSRQRVNHSLKLLEEAGLVQLEYGGITVLDLAGLKKFGE